MAIEEVEVLQPKDIEANIIEENVKKEKNRPSGIEYKATKPKGKPLGTRHISPKKWVEILQYYINGHSVKETLEKYRVGQQAFFYQLKKRNIHKIIEDERDLTPEDMAELDKEPALKDKISAELKGTQDRFNAITQANKENIVTDIANEALRLKIYDEVLPILKEKNPILAKNLSAISAKVMIRANALLDTDLSPRDLNDVASALAKINDVLQIIPKTQPLIAQQFNIGAKQDKEITIKDVDIKVEFI